MAADESIRAAASAIVPAAEVSPALVPPTPAVAGVIFGDRLPLAERYVAILADTGISHGLIGPREASRLWDRHVLNCAIAEQAMARSQDRQRVIDVGSGAGLPGIAIAIARPDLEVHLVEPLARRTAWLTDTVASLGVTNVVVHTARAESLWDELDAPWVTARAVAGIRQLAEWTLPLLTRNGSLLALKGGRARTEMEEETVELRRLGVMGLAVEELGRGLLDDVTTVLRLTIATPVDRRRFRAKGSSSAGSARRRSDRPRLPKRPNHPRAATPPTP